jgi:ubiquinone/menaquinone biosynthesis C-methylase UbiE
MSARVRTVRVFAVAAVLALAGTVHAQDAARRARMEDQREAWQRVDDIFKAMELRPGAVVADVGAGGGFFTARLSRAVGEAGRVYAVDVSARALGELRGRVSDEQLSNVVVVEGAADDPNLPAGTIDAALIVNAYHEMQDHHAMLTKVRAALKPDGRLVIVEPIAPSRRDNSRDSQVRNHEIGVEHVQNEAREAGFRVVSLQDPFTTRREGRDVEWLLVLTPVSAAPTAASEQQRTVDRKDEEWKAPGLRIPVDEFKRLMAAGNVLIVDVRDPESYRHGHLPGAILVTLEEIAEKDGADRLRNERRPIVTYCS